MVHGNAPLYAHNVAEDVRWKQRFENFERAFRLLESAVVGRALSDFSDLELEGVVQRFEYTFELAWKTVKDYLESTGIVLEQITPKAVIRAAFAAKVIQDGQAWIDMLAHRNLMSHTYDFQRFKDAVEAIAGRYVVVLDQVYLLLKKQTAED